MCRLRRPRRIGSASYPRSPNTNHGDGVDVLALPLGWRPAHFSTHYFFVLVMTNWARTRMSSDDEPTRTLNLPGSTTKLFVFTS
jgi:hypothetical protein